MTGFMAEVVGTVYGVELVMTGCLDRMMMMSFRVVMEMMSCMEVMGMTI